MAARERIVVLRNLNKYFLNDACNHLNDISKKLNSGTYSNEYKIPSSEQTLYKMFCQQNSYLKSNRHLYENWKSRNDSSKINSNFLWNSTPNQNPSLLRNSTFKKSFDRSFHSHNTRDVKTDFKKMLISNKKCNKMESTYLDNGIVTSKRPCPKCYCADEKSLKTINNLHHSNSQLILNDQYDMSDNDLLSKKFTIPTIVDFHYESDSKDLSLSKGDSIDLNQECILNVFDNSDLEELHNFRNRHYFECHSIKPRIGEKTNENEKPHFCQHNFFINDRLFLQPTYTDHNNISRCHECHLPINIELTQIDNDTTKKKYLEKKTPKNIKSKLPEVCIRFPYVENSIIPQKMNKLTIQDDIKKKIFHLQSLKKRDINYDSLALRYQKGFHLIK